MAFDPIYRGPTGLQIAMNNVNQFQQWQQQELENQRRAELDEQKYAMLLDEYQRQRAAEERQNAAFSGAFDYINQGKMGPTLNGSQPQNTQDLIRTYVEQNLSPETLGVAKSMGVDMYPADGPQKLMQVGKFVYNPNSDEWVIPPQQEDNTPKTAIRTEKTNDTMYEYWSDGSVTSKPLGEKQLTPAEQRKNAEEKKAEQVEASSKIATAKTNLDGAKSVLDEIMFAKENTGFMETGVTGSMMSKIPGTDAFDVDKRLDVVRSNAAFDRLQQMRNQSKTGGALGQVSERELALLMSTISNLDPGLSYESKMEQLTKIENQYRRAIAAYEALINSDEFNGGGNNNGWGMRKLD